MTTFESGFLRLTIAVAIAAVHVPHRAVARAEGATQAAVFLVPQIHCDTVGVGQAVGPTGFGVLLSASLRDPNAVGNYLDMARCHVTSALGPRYAEAEELLGIAMTRLQSARRAQPAPAAAAAEPGPTPLRVGAAVPPSAKVKDVPAMYPAEARASGVSGVVFVDAVIDPEGSVKDARVVGSIPPLDAAALTAVRQWKYAPTMVNGAAVEVVRLVTIKFSTTPGSSPTDGIDVARFHAAQGRYAEAEAALTQTMALVRDLRQQSAATRPLLPVRLVTGNAGEIRVPVKIFDAYPIYPRGAGEQGVQGKVVVELTITKDGLVKAARVVQSAPGLDDAALAAVRQWRYTPARSDGITVDVIMTVTVNFTI